MSATNHRGRASAAQLKQWIDAGETRVRIATRLGCSPKTVVYLCRQYDLPYPPTLYQQRSLVPAARRHAPRNNAGAIASMSPDEERDALTNGDIDEAAAERVRAARYAALRENHWELSRMVHVGEGDAADEQEKSLRHSLDGLRTFHTAAARQAGVR